jgi:hypothetical protein
MSRENQIEEMEKVIAEAFLEDYNIGCDPCTTTVAEALYNAGYRKQEWISVEERLPDGKSPFLVTNGKQIVISYRNLMYRAGGTGELRIPANYGNGMTVTHWMPLPEPPKGE